MKPSHVVVAEDLATLLTLRGNLDSTYQMTLLS